MQMGVIQLNPYRSETGTDPVLYVLVPKHIPNETTRLQAFLTKVQPNTSTDGYPQEGIRPNSLHVSCQGGYQNISVNPCRLKWTGTG